MNDRHRELVRILFDDVWNHGDIELIDEICSPDYTGEALATGTLKNREGVKQQVAMFRQAFPDFEITIEEEVAEGNRIVTYWTATGTHTAPFMGVPMTGRLVTMKGITFHRIANNKLVEGIALFDLYGLMKQLGAIHGPHVR